MPPRRALLAEIVTGIVRSVQVGSRFSSGVDVAREVRRVRRPRVLSVTGNFILDNYSMASQ